MISQKRLSNLNSTDCTFSHFLQTISNVPAHGKKVSAHWTPSAIDLWRSKLKYPRQVLSTNDEHAESWPHFLWLSGHRLSLRAWPDTIFETITVHGVLRARLLKYTMAETRKIPGNISSPSVPSIIQGGFGPCWPRSMASVPYKLRAARLLKSTTIFFPYGFRFRCRSLHMLRTVLGE